MIRDFYHVPYSLIYCLISCLISSSSNRKQCWKWQSETVNREQWRYHLRSSGTGWRGSKCTSCSGQVRRIWNVFGLPKDWTLTVVAPHFPLSCHPGWCIFGKYICVLEKALQPSWDHGQSYLQVLSCLTVWLNVRTKRCKPLSAAWSPRTHLIGLNSCCGLYLWPVLLPSCLRLQLLPNVEKKSPCPPT